MRLCRAKGVDAIFHKWAEVSEVIPPSPMVGGHSGGVIRYATAIVEFIHNGQVIEVMANDVIFCDTEKAAACLGYKKEENPPCPHGYSNWDDCPDRCHSSFSFSLIPATTTSTLVTV